MRSSGLSHIARCGTVVSQFTTAPGPEALGVQPNGVLALPLKDVEMLTKRLYSTLLDPTNYAVILNLAREYPGGLSVRQLRPTIHKTWTPTKRRVSLLEEQSLVRRLVEEPQRRKGIPYAAASRALFEYGVIEELLDQFNGTQRLAIGLERSFRFHKIPVQKEKLGLLASLTADFARLDYFDELRDEVFSPMLMANKFGPVDVAVFFVRAFLRNGVYLKRFSRGTTSKLHEEEIKHLFQHLKKQLLTEKDSGRH
jgi:hypothetical protein